MRVVENILKFAHEKAGQALAPGGWAVDATAGNGHDACFLAEAAGPGGQVWAFDVQAEALRATRRRLEARGLAERVTLLKKGHEQMQAALPPEADGRVQAVMFNLGYLPGTDKARTTQPSTTLPALDAASALLAEGGVLTVASYTGHPGGAEEALAVRRWAEALAQERFRTLRYRFLNQKNDPPQLVIVERKTTTDD